MRIKVHRWVLLIVATGLLGVTAGSAEAAAPATTLPARYVTSSTALLRGTVSTGGQRTIWAFQYGPTTNYGQTTNTRVIPAGRGTVNVSLKIAGLNRHARYHFRLLTQYGQGSVIYPIFVNFGQDRSFATRVRGRFGLGPTALRFPTRYAPVSLYCAGSATCRGTLRITHPKPGHPATLLTLARRSVTLKGGHYHTFTAKLDKAALALLKNNNDLDATLTVTPRKGHATLRKHVTLIRG